MIAIGIYALIVVNICVLLLGKYLFSYVKKKADNLAEKEDLKEIKVYQVSGVRRVKI